MSLESLTEAESQLTTARDLQYLTTDQFAILAKQIEVTNKLINGLIKKCHSMIHVA